MIISVLREKNVKNIFVLKTKTVKNVMTYFEFKGQLCSLSVSNNDMYMHKYDHISLRILIKMAWGD